MIQKPVVEMMGEVVAATQAAILPYLQSVDPKIETVHYEHGHPREITTTLQSMNSPQAYQYRKYPLIALFQDFQETIGNNIGIYGTVSLQMIIANQTEASYKAQERYARNFKPILYPVYEELLRQIARSPYFQVQNVQGIKHSKFDRVFWGTEGLYGSEKKIFMDLLDCIEIRGLQLTVRKTECNIQSLNKLNF